MKVLHVIYALSGGGAERQLRLLFKYAPANISYGVFCVDSCDADADLRAWNVECFRHQRRGRFDWGLFLSCYDVIKRFKPDVIHIWLPPVISIPALLVSIFYSHPVIFSYRNLMRFRRPLDVIEYFFALFFSNKIISNNPALQSSWPYRMLYSLKHGSLIHNGLDFSLLSPKKNFLTEIGRPVRLIFVGRLVEQKNILNLIRALVLLPSEYPWLLDVYGDGEQRDIAAQLAIILGISQNIKFHGFETNIFAKLAESDLLVMPSIYEGMPNVLIEAMATPVPVVTSEIESIVDVVEESGAVILVDPLDPKSIADGILKYLSAPDYYINRLNIGIEISSRYEAAMMSRRYYEEYQRLILESTQ